jgi:methionyl aminopeptidase
MEKEVLENYRKAGQICAKARKEAEKAFKPGEAKIRELGGEPAFPVNISINELTAHYTPSAHDQRVIESKDLVKIDIGAHVDGYIGDMAFSVCNEPGNPLIKCAEDCLNAGIKAIEPGVTVAEISHAIAETAEKAGLGVIVNLTGHTLDRHVFHGSPSIPNIKNNSTHQFKEDDVIALEPFITYNNSFIKESGPTEIYSYVQDRPVRLAEARDILVLARDGYHKLPFAKRWLLKKFSPIKVALALRQLEAAQAIQPYPVLREAEGKPVAQAEHTIIVAKKPIVTTRLAPARAETKKKA